MADLPEYTPNRGADPKTGDPNAMRGGRTTAIASWVISHAQSLMGSRNLPRSTNARQAPSVLAPTIRVPHGTTGGTAGAVPHGTTGGTAGASGGTQMQPPGGGLSRTLERAPWPTSSSFNASPRWVPWFGPGTPMKPQAPKGDVAGRAFDYATGFNMGNTPRQYSGISFEQLRALADSLDLVRLCMETRKDQMSSLGYGVLPKQDAGETLRKKSDARCQQIETFLTSPDRKHTWDQWLRLVLEDQFAIDASSIYVRRDNNGLPYALEVVDGSTIKPLLDITGRQPDAPEPAYQQILKGMPAVDYAATELLYSPRNPRPNKAYGLSPVEQIVMTVNIGIRREVVKLEYFTEGNIPEALISTPKEWQPEAIAKFQASWDSILKNSGNRAGLKFVPGEMVFQPTRSDGMLQGPFDEWLARVICYAFSLPPTAFVQQQNRATAEQAHDSGLEEGLAPLMIWFKGLMDRVIQQVFGYDDLEFVWDDVKQIDVEEERAREDQEVSSGLMSLDEVRAKRGQDPVGVNIPFIMGLGPMGIMFVDDLMEAKAAGLLKFQPPPPPQQFDEYGNPLPPPQPGMPPQPGGAPPQLGGPAPQGAISGPAPQLQLAGPPAAVPPAPAAPAAPAAVYDPLSLIPAGILAGVGLGPSATRGRSPITRKEEVQSDPEMGAVGHPQVLKTLRATEALINSRSR